MTQMLKIASAQLNPTVGALEANTAKAREVFARAKADGADILVLPEQFIIGYPADPGIQVIVVQNHSDTASVLDQDSVHGPIGPDSVLAVLEIESIIRQYDLPGLDELVSADSIIKIFKGAHAEDKLEPIFAAAEDVMVLPFGQSPAKSDPEPPKGNRRSRRGHDPFRSENQYGPAPRKISPRTRNPSKY